MAMMTEHEWITCVNPLIMLEFLRGKASPRKLRLFACACCWEVWQLLTDERHQHAVEVAEKFADGLVTGEQLHKASATAWMAHQHFTPVYLAPFMASASPRLSPAKMGWATALACAGGITPQSHLWHDSFAVWNVAREEVSNPTVQLESWQLLVEAFQEHFELQKSSIKEHFQRQTDFLRDIFGNPFRATEINPVWLTWNEGLISKMAQEIYETRHFEDMPIFGDALEEAGCREEAILEHCRSNGPHVRGCWVVDLLLGKS